ncbi:MAG: M1 family metallopeptidase [Streptosporangiaceae bacterium]
MSRGHRGRRGLRATAFAAALAVGVAVPGVALAAPGNGKGSPPNGRYEAGDPGVGDPYFPLYGNGGYNVRHYLLDAKYNPSTDHLSGTATLHATATNDLYRFDLDLVGLTVHSIVINGKRARWQRTHHELIVTPQRKLKDGEPFVAVIRYEGVPKSYEIPSLGIPSGFLRSDDGAVVAGEPEVAARWYPVNDHPQDKATYTFNVTVPKGLTVVSNGRLLTHYTRAGWTTWRWVATEPLASYLATATIGKFDTTSYTTDDGIPVFDAVDPDLHGIAKNALAKEPEVIDFLESRFGAYPFHALGGVVDDYPELYFALENQTRPIYSKYFFEPGNHPEEVYVIVHELAHQWYGDSVSVHTWKNIWLNEGFAAYAEWLWSGHTHEESPQQVFDFLYVDHPADDDFWDNKTANPGVENLFDNDSTYTRGAMALQALRMTVGDKAFFQILRQWQDQYAGSTGSTRQFTALAEKVSGQRLDGLFQQWLYEEGKPPYPIPGAAPTARAAPGGHVPQVIRSLRHRVDTGLRF